MSSDIKYLDLYNKVKQEILNLEYKVGDKIESEHKYCRENNLSRATVKKAIVLLEEEGFIETRKGYGSTVISNVPKRKTILLVVNNIYSYIYKDMISAIELYLRNNGLLTVISLSYRDFSIQTENLKNLIDNADGIILDPAQTMNVDLYRNESVYRQLLTKPTVLLSADIDGMDLPFVEINDFGATRKLTEKLVKNGKKKFLLVVNTIEKQGLNRQLGILEVLSKNNLSYEIIETTRENESYIHEKVYERVSDFSPDTLMFYNDSLVLNYLIYINELSQDINYTITGFDNIELPFVDKLDFYSPAHPKEQMGEKAAQMIIDLLNGKKVSSYSYEI